MINLYRWQILDRWIKGSPTKDDRVAYNPLPDLFLRFADEWRLRDLLNITGPTITLYCLLWWIFKIKICLRISLTASAVRRYLYEGYKDHHTLIIGYKLFSIYTSRLTMEAGLYLETRRLQCISDKYINFSNNDNAVGSQWQLY